MGAVRRHSLQYESALLCVTSTPPSPFNEEVMRDKHPTSVIWKLGCSVKIFCGCLDKYLPMLWLAEGRAGVRPLR